MYDALLIDMDDTLIHTRKVFVAAHAKLMSFIMGGSSASEEEIMLKLDEVQLIRNRASGFTVDLMPMSYLDTLLHFVPDANMTERAFAQKMGADIHTTHAELKEGVEEAIDALSRHYKLYLLTVGVPEFQQWRIDRLPFKDKFTETFIVPSKVRETYDEVIVKIGAAPHRTLMMGDSLASDIHPAVAAGLSAIHIPAPNWHAREIAGHQLPEKGAIVHPTVAAAAQYLVDLRVPKLYDAPRPLIQPIITL